MSFHYYLCNLVLRNNTPYQCRHLLDNAHPQKFQSFSITLCWLISTQSRELHQTSRLACAYAIFHYFCLFAREQYLERLFFDFKELRSENLLLSSRRIHPTGPNGSFDMDRHYTLLSQFVRFRILVCGDLNQNEDFQIILF